MRIVSAIREHRQSFFQKCTHAFFLVCGGKGAVEQLPLVVYAFRQAGFVGTVDGVFDGSVPDSSKGALYWGDLAKIERPWFMEKIVQSRRMALVSEGELTEVPAHQRVANLNGLNFWA